MCPHCLNTHPFGGAYYSQISWDKANILVLDDTPGSQGGRGRRGEEGERRIHTPKERGTEGEGEWRGRGRGGGEEAGRS